MTQVTSLGRAVHGDVSTGAMTSEDIPLDPEILLQQCRVTTDLCRSSGCLEMKDHPSGEISHVFVFALPGCCVRCKRYLDKRPGSLQLASTALLRLLPSNLISQAALISTFLVNSAFGAESSSTHFLA